MKRYTVTFKTDIPDIEEPLQRVRALGIDVRSAQKFIGTAIVDADESQLQALQDMDEVIAVTETGKMTIV